MSCSRQPTARVRSPPRRTGGGNDPSRSRRQIVVLLNPVISRTSGSLTTRPPPGGGTAERRRSTPARCYRSGLSSALPSFPSRLRRQVPCPRLVVTHRIGPPWGVLFSSNIAKRVPGPVTHPPPRSRAQPRPVAHPVAQTPSPRLSAVPRQKARSPHQQLITSGDRLFAGADRRVPSPGV